MNDRTTRLLLICGAIGAPLFVVVALIESFTRPGYDWVNHYVSDLSLSEYGWQQIANFIVSGLLLFAFAFGVGRVIRSGRGATWGPILLGIFALFLINAGIFTDDPTHGYPPNVVGATQTAHGIVHGVSGLLVFTSLAAACFVFGRRFAGDAATRGWTLLSNICGLLVLASFVLSSASDPMGWNITGLLQRVGIIAGWGWVMVLALRLLQEQREVEPN